MELTHRIAKAELMAGRREVRRNGTTEVRAEDGTLTFHGLASRTESPYDMGWYTETVRAGAFTKTLSENPDVVALVNHEGIPFAATRNGSLTLEQTADGLEFTATADEMDPDAARIAAKVASGLLSECSFAFRVMRQDWNEDRDQRVLREIDLNRGDVSVVTFGANPSTGVTLRSMLAEIDDETIDELRDDPTFLDIARRILPAPVALDELAAEFVAPESPNFSTYLARASALASRK